MSDLWSHSRDWDNGYCKGHEEGYQQGRSDERKKVLDEVYAIVLNDPQSLIEWIQDNLMD